jgi:hypothetical protein
VVTGSNDVDEIYQRMAVIRREHHTNVRESVAGAEAMADWGRYTWTYPWIALGAAAAVGYKVAHNVMEAIPGASAVESGCRGGVNRIGGQRLGLAIPGALRYHFANDPLLPCTDG